MGNYINQQKSQAVANKDSNNNKKPLKIILSGLSSAGKTTLCYRFKSIDDEIPQYPTIGLDFVKFHWNNIDMICFDGIFGGGRGGFRPIRLNSSFYRNTDVIVHVIDSSNKDTLSQSVDELYEICGFEHIKDSFLLIVANKKDLENSITIDEIKEAINFDKLNHIKTKTIIGTSALQATGIDECLNWITVKYNMKTFVEPIRETYEDVQNIIKSKSNHFKISKDVFEFLKVFLKRN